MNVRSKIICTWVSALVVFLALGIPAAAQDVSGSMNPAAPAYSGAPSAANPATAPGTVDDATLQRTARAYVKVQQISENERGAINGASDDASRKNIAQQAELKKVAAVQAEGLQPQQYNQVLALVQGDKQLEQRFLAYVQHSG